MCICVCDDDDAMAKRLLPNESERMKERRMMGKDERMCSKRWALLSAFLHPTTAAVVVFLHVSHPNFLFDDFYEV